MKDKEQVIEAEVVETSEHQKRFDMVETEASLPAFTPMNMIQQAVASGEGLETMERLFDLQVKYEENEAKKAYFAAFAAFKSEAININKDATVGYTGKKGFVGYNHASIGNVIATITPFLSKNQLSLNWDTVQDAGSIKVTCTLTHALGFSQSTSLEAGKDDTGNKNEIQQVISTQTYLQRHTALAITGLATQDQPDDDGKGDDPEPVDVIDECQLADLDALIDDVKANRSGFLKAYKIESLEMLPADMLKHACESLNAKRKS